jgi:hypothetical protein
MATRASQVTAGALGSVVAHVRASQVAADILGTITPRVRASQVCIQVLIANLERYVPPTFPTLRGLGFSVIKRPKWSNNTQQHVSGREVRIGYYTMPLWEWDLLYEVLPDTGSEFRGTTTSDVRTMLDFYNSCAGGLSLFFFSDPDDYTVTEQQIGTGDGSTTTFTLTRTLVTGGFAEPIGYVDLTNPFNVYVAGTLQSGSAYTVSQTTYYQQTITFAVAPPSGDAVAVTMNYFQVCKFKDDTYDFEKFAYALWGLKKITLATTRGT